MVAIIICIFICAVIVLGAEALWRLKVLRGESQRKLIHIATGCFVASWPWLMSWRAIWIIGLAMAAVVAANRILPIFHFSSRIGRESYGDIFFALAITISALLVTNKIYFMIAILNMSLADGAAALVGKKFGQKHKYQVFGQTKTAIGTATFWLVSFFVVGIGLLYNTQSTHDYALVIIFLPPLLALIENCMVLGFDNLAVPLIALVALSTLN